MISTTQDAESKITMFYVKLQVNYNYDSNSFDISVIPTRSVIPKPSA